MHSIPWCVSFIVGRTSGRGLWSANPKQPVKDRSVNVNVHQLFVQRHRANFFSILDGHCAFLSQDISSACETDKCVWNIFWMTLENLTAWGEWRLFLKILKKSKLCEGDSWKDWGCCFYEICVNTVVFAGFGWYNIVSEKLLQRVVWSINKVEGAFLLLSISRR